MDMNVDTNMDPSLTGLPQMGGLAPATSRCNPRRCSPEDSVSLRPALKSRFSSRPSQAAPTSTVGQPGIIGYRGVPQGSESPSSAEEWFKETNENVRGQAHNLLHESPFFLNSTGNDSHSDVELPYPQLWDSTRFASRDSENSDLRDVIDDLTIENRKLKQRLKKYQKSQMSNLHHDKMFEVKMHGLSASKQRDLEDLLRDFVTKANVKDHRAPGSSTNVSSNYMGAGVSLFSRASKPGLSLPTDSGYASMAKSGTSGHSGPASNTTSSQGRIDPRLSSKSRNKNVQSYLHNIPESLMPKVMPRSMTEREQKKLVVQRLEQVFTGRSAAPGPHSQPLQQQEVSNIAAKENRFKLEGHREARIMTDQEQGEIERSPKRRRLSHVEGSDVSPHKSPDQRPTRPLDLDIHRAQVPSDNMNYIRHLGLPSPTRHREEDDDGWVYLNLLTSMAQLHTIHVTPEFIRQAISDVSDKFEVSADGRKVRWKGGDEGTLFSSDNSSNTDVTNGESPPESNDSLRPSSISSTVANSGNASKNVSPLGISSGQPLSGRASSGNVLLSRSIKRSSSSQLPDSRSSNLFDYKPMVLRHQMSTSESEETGYAEYESAPASRLGMDDTTRRSSFNDLFGSSERQGNSNNRADGSIIYYRNATFYADLLGDRKALAKAMAPVEGQEQYILGIPPKHDLYADSDVHQALPRSEVDPIRPENYTAKDFSSLKLVPLSDSTEMHQSFQELPVCGIGGVVPQDNFLIDVKTKHSIKSQSAGKQKQKQPAKNYEVVSTETLDLAPSKLPPPSYVFLPVTSSSSSNFDDDCEEEYSESSANEDEPAPPAMLHQLSSNDYEDSDEEDEEDEADDEEDDDDDSSSIDMLHAARAADPDAIAAQEREYDMGNMERILPEELPAGSSAATAGGGSGYATPEREGSLMSMDIGPPSLKRGRSTTDSMASNSRSWKTPRK